MIGIHMTLGAAGLEASNWNKFTLFRDRDRWSIDFLLTPYDAPQAYYEGGYAKLMSNKR